MKTRSSSHWLYRVAPFLRWWPQVGRDSLKADLLAGLIGAAIVLPQGVAFASDIGKDACFAEKRDAIAGIYEQLDKEVCAKCRARIFEECGQAGKVSPQDTAS